MSSPFASEPYPLSSHSMISRFHMRFLAVSRCTPISCPSAAPVVSDGCHIIIFLKSITWPIWSLKKLETILHFNKNLMGKIWNVILVSIIGKIPLFPYNPSLKPENPICSVSKGIPTDFKQGKGMRRKESYNMDCNVTVMARTAPSRIPWSSE